MKVYDKEQWEKSKKRQELKLNLYNFWDSKKCPMSEMVKFRLNFNSSYKITH